MAQARSAATTQTVPRVQVIAPAHIGQTAIAALRSRGIDARASTRADAPTDDVVAWALDSAPSATSAVELAQICDRAARTGRPVCLFAPLTRGTARVTVERAAAVAYLRAHGAALAHDIDVWLESIVALVRFGMPRGPHAAVIAPEGSWLEAQALAIAADAEAAGTRPPQIGRTGDDPTDVVLFDPALGPVPGNLPGLHVPVIARAELGASEVALFGARTALAAYEVLGRVAERTAAGLGPAPVSAADELSIDREQLARQLAKLARNQRVGDHETKVLLRAFGVAITRQVVATTPSAAVKRAREVRYPVELKPWGHDLPTEPEGCPIERNITSDALLRRAYSSVLAAAGKISTQNDPGAVIVREPPPLGRDIVVQFLDLHPLGWTVIVEAPGTSKLAAAPAPLRLIDAEALARVIVASRAGDPDPDRTGLANLLRRASHLVVELGAQIESLALPRVVVGGRGARTVVVDAWCKLT